MIYGGAAKYSNVDSNIRDAERTPANPGEQ